MKHKREIRIKSPRLRTLRNNLREIIWLEWDKRGLWIIQSQSGLIDTKLSQGEKLKLRKELENKLEQNQKLMKSSIVMCGWCHHRDRDAIYNPSNHQWFCPDCYSMHKEDILNSTSFIY